MAWSDNEKRIFQSIYGSTDFTNNDDVISKLKAGSSANAAIDWINHYSKEKNKVIEFEKTYKKPISEDFLNEAGLNYKDGHSPITGKDDYYDVNKFQTLLSKLENSKAKQQRQKSVENRRDIFAKGLADMFSNF
tara:strand:- start:623 stop:1024 length:402 start_codon:yes stop_codon:yes gene_type:complete